MADKDPSEEGNVVDVKALADTVTSLVSVVSGMGKNVEILTGSMRDLQEKGVKAVLPTPDPDDTDDDLDADMEGMSRPEFANHLMKQFSNVMKGELKTIQESVQTVGDTATQERVASMVKEAKSQNKDFDEWTDELKGVLKESPGTTLKRALTIVRSEDPKKATELREKYQMDDPGENKGKGDGKHGGEKFGGLTPKGGETTPDTRMKQGEAADSAWDSALAATDGLDPSMLNGTS